MKKNAGFGLVYTLAAVVVVAAIVVAGVSVYRNNHKTTNNSDNTNTSSQTAKQNSNAQTVDPYAGWKTYSSSVEKVTFRYPSDWTIDTADQIASNDPNNSDYTALKSPDGKVVVHWTSLIDGFGNEHGTSYPSHIVVEKTAISKASGDFVVSGISTLDGSSYYPWIAVINNESYGVLSSGVQGSLDLFMGQNNINSSTSKPDTALFSTSGSHVNQGAPALTQSDAKAYLANSDMQQAKLILLSLSY